MDELGALLETGGFAALELAASALAERGGQTPPCPSCGKPMSAYFLLSLKIFYRQGWFLTASKFAGISLVHFFFFLCPTLGVAVVASVVAG